MCVCVRVCVCECMYVCTCTYAHVCTCTYAHVCLSANVFVCACVHSMCVHVCVHSIKEKITLVLLCYHITAKVNYALLSVLLQHRNV